jgi:hypothetical protein
MLEWRFAPRMTAVPHDLAISPAPKVVRRVPSADGSGLALFRRESLRAKSARFRSRPAKGVAGLHSGIGT